MKRQSKVKHQGPSVEDEGETSGLSGDTAETEKVRVGKGDGSDYEKSLNPDPVQTDHILEGGSLIKRLKSIRNHSVDEVRSVDPNFPLRQTDHSSRHRSELFHTEEAKNRKFKKLRLISRRRQKRKSPVVLVKYRSLNMDSSRMKQSSVIKEEGGGVSWEMSGHRQEEELVKDRKTEPDQQTKHLDQSVFGSAETQKVQDVSCLTTALPFQVCSSDDDKMHTSQIWPTGLSRRHIGSSSCLIQATDDESLDSHPDSSIFPKIEMSSTRLPTELYHYYLPSEIPDSASSQDLNYLPGESQVYHHLSPLFMSSSSQPKKESTIPPPVPSAPWGSTFSTSTFPVNSHVFLPEKKPQVEHQHFSNSMPSYPYLHSKKKSTIPSAAAHQPGLYYLPSEIPDSASSQDLNYLPGESQVYHHLSPCFMSSSSQPKKESTIPPPVPSAPRVSTSSISISPMSSHVFLPEKKPQVEHQHFSRFMPPYSYPHSKNKSTISSAAAHQPGLYYHYLPSEIPDSASSEDPIFLPQVLPESHVYHQHLPSPMPLKTCHSAASHPSLSIYTKILDILRKRKPQVDHHNFSLVESHPHPKPGDSGYSENKTSRVQSPFPNRPKVTVEPHEATNVLSTHSHHVQPLYSRRSSRCLSRSHSDPSLSKVTSAETETLKRSKNLPDMKLNSSFEEFTPDISVGEDDETYSFRFSRSGLYQCSVTGLLFHMEGEGDVVYRTVPWNRRLLAQHHKKPAGPLFDIKCEQQSVCQLHLPHCEILSTGRCHFLSVAHVNDDVIEFISPHKITETHVVINITGFSEFGNVKDEGAPPDPVQALVLLFYKPPTNPDPESVINVLMLPRNISLPDVLRYRKKLGGDERYIEMSSKCKLHPDQDYTLSTCPEDDSVLVQPTEAEFDCSNYDNYFPSFQVELERIMKHIKLLLRDKHSSNTVWERRVCLSYSGVKRSCEPSPLDLPSERRLLDVRSSFIESVSDPVLKTLLDQLFDKKVITDSERESADEMQNKRDKARRVIDTVRRKGEAASSEMIKFLCELDPFLCEHLGLM